MEKDCVAKLLVAHRGKLLAYLWSLLRDHATVEDLYQDVLMAAMEKADEIKDADHLLPWARRAARFRAIDYLRRNNRRPVLLEGDVIDLLEPAWRALDATPQTRRIEALANCLKKLTSYSRRLIEMRYVEDRSGTEIAQSLGRQPHAIYTALSRAYQALGECVERQLAREEHA